MYERVRERTSEKETKQHLKKCYLHFKIKHDIQKGQTVFMQLVDRSLPMTDLAYAMTLLKFLVSSVFCLVFLLQSTGVDYRLFPA